MTTAARPLGRGLSALLGPENDLETAPVGTKVETILLHEAVAGKYQPREHFDTDAFASLVASIRERGIIQPILVRPLIRGLAKYEIIAGERRWRAAKEAGLLEIPAIVMDLDDRQALETALIENIQRHDLNPLEEAQGYYRLMEEFSYTQEEMAKVLGKSRSHIANTLRLMNTTDKIKAWLKEGKLSAGHARALIGHDQADEIAEKAIRQGLSVRQVEKLATKNPSAINLNHQDAITVGAVKQSLDPEVQALQELLSEALAAPITIRLAADHQGSISIHFKSMQELDRLMNRLCEVKS
ncbi:MAG: ParB/RepB/Spo0J family partition protein [Holosporales bacterium]